MLRLWKTPHSAESVRSVGVECKSLTSGMSLESLCLSLSENSLPADVSIVDYVEEAAGKGWELKKTDCGKTFAIVEGNQEKEAIAKEAFAKLTSELQVKVAQVYNNMSETAPKSYDIRFILISSIRGVAEPIFNGEPIPEGIASMSCVFGLLASLVGKNGEVGDTHHYRAISKQALEKFLGDKCSKSNLLRLSPVSWADADDSDEEEEARDNSSVTSKTLPNREKLIKVLFGKIEDELTSQELTRLGLSYKVAKHFHGTYETVRLKNRLSSNGNPYLKIEGFERFDKDISNMKEFMRENKISWKTKDSNDLSLNYLWKNLIEEESTMCSQQSVLHESGQEPYNHFKHFPGGGGLDPKWEGLMRVKKEKAEREAMEERIAELEKYIEELQGQERERVEMLEKKLAEEREKADASQRRMIAEYEAQLLALERQNQQLLLQLQHQIPQYQHFPQMQFAQEQIVQEQIVQEHIVQEPIVQVQQGGKEDSWKMIAVALAALLLGVFLTKVL